MAINKPHKSIFQDSELIGYINVLLEEIDQLKAVNRKLMSDKRVPEKALKEALDIVMAQNNEMQMARETLSIQNEELKEREQELVLKNQQLKQSETLLAALLGEVAESKGKYKSIIDAFDGLICLVDEDRTIEYCNNKLPNFKCQNKQRYCFELLYRKEKPCENCVSKCISYDDQVFSEEHYFKSHDKYYNIVHSKVFIGEKSSGKTLLLIRDITERKLLELELENERNNLEEVVEERTRELNSSLETLKLMNFNLQEVNKHKDKFLSCMSHELRTPLNAIIGFASILEKTYYGSLNEKQSEYIGLIHSSGDHLLSLINDLLDYAKIESGNMDLHLATFFLNETAMKVYYLLEEQYKEKNIEFVTDLDKNIELVNLDDRKVQQILLNYLSNALKYTPENGKVVLKTELIEGNFIRISVKDNGIGVAEETQEKIFSEFYQAENPVNADRGGTGIGLAITKNLAELQGGRVGLESKPEKGSVFWVELPVIFIES